MEMIYAVERWDVEAEPRVIDDMSISWQRNHGMEEPSATFGERWECLIRLGYCALSLP